MFVHNTQSSLTNTTKNMKSDQAYPYNLASVWQLRVINSHRAPSRHENLSPA